MIEALEKLRQVDYHPGYHGEPTLLMIADEIQAEIDREYMCLPVDADGVPIKLDDEMVRISTGWKCTVSAVSDGCFYAPEGGCKLHKASNFRHVKPRTVEDVLMDVLRDSTHPDMGNSDIIEKYAAELQMRGDAE